jgi:hypothetical protein
MVSRQSPARARLLAELGANIERWRKLQGLSAVQFAERAPGTGAGCRHGHEEPLMSRGLFSFFSTPWCFCGAFSGDRQFLRARVDVVASQQAAVRDIRFAAWSPSTGAARSTRGLGLLIRRALDRYVRHLREPRHFVVI